MNGLMRVSRVVILACTFCFASLSIFGQDLEIHHINVQQGTSVLMVGPTGTTLLYDGGNIGKGNSEVIPYLQSQGITTALDYMVLSHRDADHYGGLTEVINSGIDVTAAVYDNGSDKTSTTITDFINASATTTAGTVSQIPLGTVIDLGGGATATCVVVNGDVLGVGAISGALNNENDRSVGLLVQYGDFDFLICGDLGGGDSDNSCTGRSTSQVDVETPLVQAISPGGANPLLTDQGVEVHHVNHHGSESSTNSDIMNLLTPSLACISVGAGQGGNFHHPRQDVVESVLHAQASCVTAASALVLQTEEGDPTGASTSFAGYSVGDIIITTDGVNDFLVDASGAVTQGPDERVAGGLPLTMALDVPAPAIAVTFSEIFYDTPGTDSQEEWIELYNNTTSTVDLGGWTITDDNGSGASFSIPAGVTIAPASYLTIAADQTGFQALYGFDADVYGAIPALNNTGDALLLLDDLGSEADAVAWEGGASSGTPAGWGSTSDPNASTGNSITRTDPLIDNNIFSDWSVLAANGDPQTQSSSAPTIVFSEIFYDTPGTDSDEEWVELYNAGTGVVDIGGWTITDNNGTGSAFTIPGGMTIQPGTYFTIAADQTGFLALYGYDADTYGSLPSLNNTGDALILADAGAAEFDAVAWEGGASGGTPAGWGSTTEPNASSGNSVVRNDPLVDTDTFSDWGILAANGNPQTQGVMNLLPIAVANGPYSAVENNNISFSSAGSNDPDGTITTYSWDFGDGNSSTQASPQHAYTTAGTYTVILTVTDDGGATGSDTTTATITPVSTSSILLAEGIVSGVSDSWTTVTLANTYSSMVVVGSVNYGAGDLPAVVRIRNASGNSFDVRVQNPSGAALSGYAVHYVVAEEGTYTAAVDGVDMEAVKVSSTITDSRGSWVGQAQTYANSYTSPVVIGQIMTENDANWSVFWASNGNRTSAPTASAISVGKHVGEDSNTSRANETIGYIVIESGSGTIDGIDYSAGLGSDIVRGFDNSPAYSYSNSDLSNITNAVVSAAAMDGNDGGWPILYGADPLLSATLDLAFDEDQISNSERRHTTEQVAWFAVGTSASASLAKAGIEDGFTETIHEFSLAQNYPNPFNPETTIEFTIAQEGFVNLMIFDALGRRVTTLVQEHKAPGTYKVRWNGRDARGESVASGMYLYRLQSGSKVLTGRMILIK